MVAVPCEQRGTGTAAAVNLGELLLAVSRNLDFILENPGRPKHAYDIRFSGRAEPGNDFGRVLAQITGGSGDFPLLAIRACEDFDFSADRGLVIVQSFERQPQPVVLVSALVAQQNRAAMILGNHEVGSAIAVVVAGYNRTWIFQLNFVETNISSDVFKTVRAKIAEEADFALAFFGLADSRHVHPAIVVIIKRRHAPAADPIGCRQSYGFEALAPVVAPERQARRVPVGESYIHPTVMVEVQNGNADCGRGDRSGPRFTRGKLPFTGILEDDRRAMPAGDHNVDGAVVVVIRAGCANVGAVA